MLKSVRFIFLIFSVVALSLTSAKATHLRAGDITVTRYSCSSYKYKITLHIYTRCSSPVKFGGGVLSFGDGETYTTDERPSPPQISSVDGGICEVIYSVDHEYRGGGVFTITYYEQNRNEGILNIANSVNVPFFVQTQLVIDDFLGCDNSPQLLVPPIDMGCTGVAWLHNPGAYDPDGDSLSYELYTPKLGAIYDADGLYVSSIDVAYTSPASSAFSHTRESGTGTPVFEIDHVTGTVKWDAPGVEGEYNIAFIIREWRKYEGVWVPMGYVERDMQVIIQSCQNKRPILQLVPDVCVLAGDTVKGTFTATDPAFALPRSAYDGDSTKIEAFSQVFSINPSPATYQPFPVKWQQTVTDVEKATLNFFWKTECAHVKEQPYEVVFKATDNGTPQLATFATWRIKVVGPAPQLISATSNSIKRTARLKWVKYTCKNAAFIQVWRRVDSVAYVQPECETGMPDNLGYQLINQTSVDSIGYTDKNLAVGARYCYRLVAVFPQPDGGESRVSNELCIPPILVVAPVITNVTVDITDTSAGQITLKWRSPFETNKTQFPRPFYYDVYRAEGFTGNINLVKVNPGKIKGDTLWVDKEIGLNTAEVIYNYRVLCYDSNKVFIDTSAVASSVRLDLKPLFKQIELNWNADVPWSNDNPSYKFHLIYRGTNTNSKTISDFDFTLIDSVDVTTQKFAYLDSGQYQNTPLVQSQEYCYAVVTRGSYGNPKISNHDPLINLSEITCTIPDNQTKPCKPVLVLKGYDCGSFNNCYEVGKALATNTVKWRRPTDPDCRNEIKGYNVYAANSIGDTFVKIAELVKDTFYVHNNLQSYAQCYKVTAVSRADKESDPSDQFCFDNCPYYELPNVFTPNGDGCNDKFSAFNINNYPDEGWPCGHKFLIPGTNILDTAKNQKLDTAHFENIKSRCARFVLAVDLRVYNRWGKEVYSYQYDNNVQSEGVDNSLYIDWNGKDNNGHDLDPGVYYYAANVVFAVVDPKSRNKTIKGWVQIFR